MLTVFFDYRAVVHYEFLPTDQNVNKEYYLSDMPHNREAIHKKRPELWYGPTTLGFCTTIDKNSTHVAPQPPYSV